MQKGFCWAEKPPRQGVGLAQRSREARRKRFPRSGIQPLSHGVLILNRRAGSPCTEEPRNAPQTPAANLAQGSRECAPKHERLRAKEPRNARKPSLRGLHRGAERHGVNAFPGRGIQPLSLFGLETSRKSSSPCTGEPRMCAEARAAKGEGAEKRPQSAGCGSCTGAAGTAAEPPSAKGKLRNGSSLRKIGKTIKNYRKKERKKLYENKFNAGKRFSRVRKGRKL